MSNNKTPTIANHDSIWGILASWKNKKMLKAISGSPLVDNEKITFNKSSDGTEQIYMNRKPSGVRIDSDGMINGDFFSKLTWIDRLQYQRNIKKSQLLRHIIRNFSEKISIEYMEKYKADNFLHKGKINRPAISEYLQENQRFQGTKGNIFQYQHTGIRKPLNKYKVKQIIQEEIKYFLGVVFTDQDVNGIYSLLKGNCENETLEKKLMEKNIYDIPFADGIYHAKLDFLRTYTPEEYKFTQLPYCYEDIKCCQEPVLRLRFLHQVFASYADIEGVISLLQTWIGYLLIPSTHLEKIIYMKGKGINGKGTVIRIIRMLLGEHNCTNIELSELRDTDMYCLIGKLCAIESDSDEIRMDRGRIKKIASGESIFGRQRFKDEIQFTPHCKIIIASNEDPFIKRKDNSIKRRLLILNFLENFEETKDTELVDKLATELPQILRRALVGLKKLLADGDFIIPQEVQELMDVFFMGTEKSHTSDSETDPISEFIKQANLKKGAVHVSYDSIYKGFVDSCTKKNVKNVIKKDKFIQLFPKYGFTRTRKSGHRGVGLDSELANHEIMTEFIPP